ncbi:MAG: acyl-CoA dehydrogenase family protein [Actinomycetota bacterium]
MEQPSIDEFRHQVETFFHHTLPGAVDPAQPTMARAKAWRALLHAEGLAGIEYPVEFGGRGLSAEHARVYGEVARGLIPREESVFGIGVGMALPTIRDLGSDELKARFIEPGLRGDEIWCQMYSEPGSGSDLASLATKAELDGDEWVVTGQKVWTSGAHHSQYAILLARTDPTLPKHRGITMFVLPVEQPGVTVRPLVQMTGEAEFNEVFLDEARIPADWVVGEVNGGWRTAVALLAHERVQTGVASTSGDEEQRSRAGRTPIPSAQLRAAAAERGRGDDAVVRQELARQHTGERIIATMRDRGDVHPSIGKLWRTRLGRGAADVAARLVLDGGAAWTPDREHDDEGYFAFQVLNCRGMSLGGGTDEIQRNTIGERVLGLPREPSEDRDLPFNRLPRS